MKKHIGIIAGVIVTLWYCMIETFLLNSPLFEYNEKYDVIQSLMLYILPSVSGIITMLFLRRNSVKDFLMSWISYFLISLILMVIYEFSRLPLMMHCWFTGYDEFGMGDGLLVVVILSTHFIACAIGVLISGLISWRRQRNGNDLTT